jgi:hypothetical protein
MPVDPTNELMRSLADRSKWELTSGVPLFKAHVRDVPNEAPIVVRDEDLPEIANRINATIKETGRLPTFTLGHRKFGPVDEKTQPDLLGFHTNFRAAPVTRDGKTFLALVADEYAAKDKASEHDLYRKFPFRSAEYHPAAGYKGAAALQQPPWLDLGTVYHYADSTALYQTDPIPMNDTAEPVDAKGTAPNPAAETGGAWTPDDDAAYAMFCKYAMKYESEKSQQNMAAAGATNAAMPKPAAPPKEPEMSKYQATGDAAVNATVLELQAKVAALEAERTRSTCEKLLSPLVPYFKFDQAREVAMMMTYQSDADRANHAKYIADNYTKLPTGGMIGIYQGEVRPQGLPAGGKPDLDPMLITPELHTKIKAYAAANACSYGEATTAVTKAA